MDIKDLKLASMDAKEMLVKALTEYVRENGEEMCDYFYNQFGMYEEDEEGVKIVKVLDTSELGCFFSHHYYVNDEKLKDISRHDEGFEIFDKLEDSFGFSTYWAFYIVNENGDENLKYYKFYNNGVCYQDDSDPDHDYVYSLTVPELGYILESIIKETA